MARASFGGFVLLLCARGAPRVDLRPCREVRSIGDKFERPSTEKDAAAEVEALIDDSSGHFPDEPPPRLHPARNIIWQLGARRFKTPATDPFSDYRPCFSADPPVPRPRPGRRVAVQRCSVIPCSNTPLSGSYRPAQLTLSKVNTIMCSLG